MTWRSGSQSIVWGTLRDFQGQNYSHKNSKTAFSFYIHSPRSIWGSFPEGTKHML